MKNEHFKLKVELRKRDYKEEDRMLDTPIIHAINSVRIIDNLLEVAKTNMEYPPLTDDIYAYGDAGERQFNIYYQKSKTLYIPFCKAVRDCEKSIKEIRNSTYNKEIKESMILLLEKSISRMMEYIKDLEEINDLEGK